MDFLRLDRWRYYRFEQEWAVEAPVAAVWNGMLHVEAWPQWWEGLEFCLPENELSVGTEGKQYSTRWKGLLPYGLNIQAVLREVNDLALITADIHGDLEGQCSCRIQQTRRGTCGVFSLKVRTTRLWMSLLSPFIKGYFIENHKSLMAQGMTGFTRYLAAEDC
ncbi:hypothetical protein [Desulfoluna sp.]|uniref:hypothetical protein n=1 Tax=Desulfoluna sp. TaxID=2045199 RepID=UPI002632945E|nr:hypothetical protein [Desulfoluna sp.]